MDNSTLTNAIRFLAVDMIQKANSGHPGAPLGMAEIALVLWKNFLNHNPNNPNFYNRDRFVLSNGHASALLYTMLHLTGYNLSIEELKNFRQYGSKTPGHPELGHTAGIETSTGPLGQGIANAVGMAIAEKNLALEFNKPNLNIIDHYTYVFVGDGCLMEGISYEATSLAGTLGLNKLIVLYDSNNISIDGNIKGWFNDDIKKRFEALGWYVINNIDGHNIEEINQAIKNAKQQKEKPTIICCNTIIGRGSPNKEGSHKTHGSPLGPDEINNMRKSLKWNHPEFFIPEEIYDEFDATKYGKKLEQKWNQLFATYKEKYPQEANELIRRLEYKLTPSFEKEMEKYLRKIINNKENIATRNASQNTINILAKELPELLGGSADLTPSNLTNWDNNIALSKNNYGNYIHYGVREFSMVAITNGIFLHGGYRPFSATFLIFSEYARNAIRMASLMGIGSIFVFTHDSIGVGEDGPTHQPIEQIPSLRLIPNISIWRPCDTVETFIAWQEAIKTINKPTCLIFSRQNLSFIERDDKTIENIRKGGYIIKNSNTSKLDAIIIATGSEVSLAIKTLEELTKKDIYVNVVSIPNTNIFDLQDKTYKEQVLPKNIPKIAVEAAYPDFWYKYVGTNGKVLGINDYSKSAPASILFEKNGFTVKNLVNLVIKAIKES